MNRARTAGPGQAFVTVSTRQRSFFRRTNDLWNTWTDDLNGDYKTEIETAKGRAELKFRSEKQKQINKPKFII